MSENIDVFLNRGGYITINGMTDSDIREGVLKIQTSDEVYIFPLASISHTRAYLVEN